MKLPRLLLCIVAAMALLAVPGCSQQGGAGEGSDSAAGAQGSSNITVADQVKVIAAEEVAGLPSGTYLVDTRTVEEYEEGHIPGALNASYPRSTGGPCQAEDNAAVFRSNWEQLEIPEDASVVVYCRTGKRAAAAASVLIEDGYTDVSLYEGSWTDWTSNPGRPIEK